MPFLLVGYFTFSNDSILSVETGCNASMSIQVCTSYMDGSLWIVMVVLYSFYHQEISTYYLNLSWYIGSIFLLL